MASRGPDRGYAWVIVFSCAFTNFALFGIFRSAGVLYVALIHEYHVTREEASWPFSLCSAIFQLTGTFASVLVQFTTLRKLSLLGAAIATAGVTCCFFANSIFWINVSYGVVHGVGFGLVVIMVPVIINQYFLRHRATAMGWSFAGSAVSSFVFPPLIEYFLQEYGLKGTFLILSGIIMNTLVACAFLRAPPWIMKKHNVQNNCPLESTKQEDRDSGVSTFEESPCNDDILDNKNLEIKYNEPLKMNDAGEVTLDDCKTFLPGHDNTQDESSKLAKESNDVLMIPTQRDRVKCEDRGPRYDSKKEHGRIESEALLENKVKQVMVLPRVKEGSVKTSGCARAVRSKILASVCEILRHPMFHLLTFSTIVFFTGIHSFFIVIVDFAKDKGIPEIEAIYLMSVFSLTDLFGRVALGWVTDRKFISRKNMFMIDISLIGVVFLSYPFCDSFSTFSAAAVFHGLAVGSAITLIYVLQAEYLGVKNQVYFCGLGSFIGSFTTFLRPPMVGLFRDSIGSYDWMFCFLGSLYLLTAFMWLAEPWLLRKVKQRKEHLHNDVQSCTFENI